MRSATLGVEQDLAFADFDGSERLYPAPTSDSDPKNQDAPGVNHRGRSRFLEHETGFEPATLTLARWKSTKGVTWGCVSDPAERGK
jgi:hypothetical protein